MLFRSVCWSAVRSLVHLWDTSFCAFLNERPQEVHDVLITWSNCLSVFVTMGWGHLTYAVS